MTELIIAMVILYIFATTFIGLGWIHCFEEDIWSPRQIYKLTKLNWFGAIIVYILFILTGFTIWLYEVIYYACHLGRKEFMDDERQR